MNTLNHYPTGLIKICGLTRAEDVVMCAAAGADWLGFIFHPRSPRSVSPQAVAGFDSGRAKRVGIFVNQRPEEVLAVMREARLDLAQLHGGQDENFIRRIGADRVISVHWPEKYQSPSEMRPDLEEKRSAAFHLFDAGAAGGGHGRRLDLSFLRDLNPPGPWLLAGGLNAEMVESLELKGLKGLAGFDFNSGLEDQPGRKNESKVRAAAAVARKVLNLYYQGF